MPEGYLVELNATCFPSGDQVGPALFGPWSVSFVRARRPRSWVQRSVVFGADDTAAMIELASGENLRLELADPRVTLSFTTLVGVPRRLTITICPWPPVAVEFGR